MKIVAVLASLFVFSIVATTIQYSSASHQATTITASTTSLKIVDEYGSQVNSLFTANQPVDAKTLVLRPAG
jgi:hypothetical protein